MTLDQMGSMARLLSVLRLGAEEVSRPVACPDRGHLVRSHTVRRPFTIPPWLGAGDANGPWVRSIEPPRTRARLGQNEKQEAEDE